MERAGPSRRGHRPRAATPAGTHAGERIMNPIRVGLIGASPDRGWAFSAHIPALKALPDFELAAVCTTRQESADAVAQKFGIPHAFGDWRAMVARPDIDLVIVTVKVRAHRDLVLGALAAGKHVFCE